MNQFNTQVQSAPAMDLGLRSFMLGTYRYMAMAMGVTAIVAYGFSVYLAGNPGLAQALYGGIWMWLGFIAVITIGSSMVIKRLPTMSMGSMLAVLFGFAALLGVFAAPIAVLATSSPESGATVARVFLMAVAMFGGLSLFGYTTGFNLNSIIKYAGAIFTAYVLISIAGVAYEPLRIGGGMETVFHIVGLVAIAGITAWETQKLKQTYYAVAGDASMQSKLSAFGAAFLLLSFYNIFVILMQLFGRD